jgi:hypothetical protein
MRIFHLALLGVSSLAGWSQQSSEPPIPFLFPQFGYSQLRSQQGEGGSTDFLSTINFQL